ncbi:MAG: (2Fe-2S)-binding protein [Deltaproteobacteria bacterium]|nr:(2Fe-2S)-binding protein [Deltaproteobacteria bacterium]
MKKEIAKFTINDRPYELLVESNVTLAELLREQLDLTGTKCACGVGECGSCTVLIDGKPTLSCSTLAIAVREKDILTIESLATREGLHPIQQAFIDHGAIQCGFCTPGMIMMTKALLDENPDPTEQEVKEGIGGNLCRCTGYVKIVDGILAAAESMGKEGGR